MDDKRKFCAIRKNYILVLPLRIKLSLSLLNQKCIDECKDKCSLKYRQPLLQWVLTQVMAWTLNNVFDLYKYPHDDMKWLCALIIWCTLWNIFPKRGEVQRLREGCTSPIYWTSLFQLSISHSDTPTPPNWNLRISVHQQIIWKSFLDLKNSFY